MEYEKNSEKPPNYENGHVSPNGSPEKGTRRLSIGHVSENREDDFMTRNGLNLQSFKRRESAAQPTASRDLTALQGLMMGPVWLSLIVP